VLEGELVFQVEDALITKRAGEIAFAPRGAPEWALQEIPFEVERVGPQIGKS
jgi:quercetin dioxygenase-like cupin family protein